MVLNEQTCEYMIMRAKTCLTNGDAAYAKCWIMTAAALFPQNDQIKFEAYNMCKCEGNVEEASKYFCEIFASGTGQLNDEMKLIVNACRSEWQTHGITNDTIITNSWSNNSAKSKVSNTFFSKLFISLSPHHQHQLLLRVADNTDDTMTIVNLMLFILKKFPEKVTEHGLRLVEIMSDGEKCDESWYLRKKLVFDVMPIVFGQKSLLILPHEKVQNLMQKSLKFFIEQTIRTDNCDTTERENADVVESKIMEIFHLIGLKINWKLLTDDSDKLNTLDSKYENISHFIDQLRYAGDGSSSPIDLSSAAKINSDEQTNEQILYATLLLFLRCLRRYVKLSHEMVLIEQSVSQISDTKLVISASKKRKLQLMEPEVISDNMELRQTFIVATKCLRLIKENSGIKKEFCRIIESVNLDKCRAYRSLAIDSNIYKSEYEEATAILLRKKSLSLKNNVQLISVSLMLHDYNATLKYCLDTIESVRFNPTNDSEKPKLSHHHPLVGSTYRHLQFIPLSTDEIVRYVVEVIISCLKDRVIMSIKPSDTGIGHLIVLSQYNWPNHVELFFKCMSMIKNNPTKHSSQPKFVYTPFLNYIFIPDIIEEFMSILDDFVLELKVSGPTLGTSLKSAKTITRGINKGAKEEVKISLISQMKNSKTHITNELFIDFINKEIRMFLQNLTK